MAAYFMNARDFSYEVIVDETFFYENHYYFCNEIKSPDPPSVPDLHLQFCTTA